MHRLPLILIALLAADGAAARNRGLTPAHAPVVQRGLAFVPGCPDWSDARTNAVETTNSNFGCASSSNLAAMVADPADLLHGRDDPMSPGHTAARAVTAWRAVEPFSKKWEVTIPATMGGGK